MVQSKIPKPKVKPKLVELTESLAKLKAKSPESITKAHGEAPKVDPIIGTAEVPYVDKLSAGTENLFSAADEVLKGYEKPKGAVGKLFNAVASGQYNLDLAKPGRGFLHARLLNLHDLMGVVNDFADNVRGSLFDELGKAADIPREAMRFASKESEELFKSGLHMGEYPKSALEELFARRAVLGDNIAALSKGEGITLRLSPDDLVGEIKKIDSIIQSNPRVAKAFSDLSRIAAEVHGPWLESRKALGLETPELRGPLEYLPRIASDKKALANFYRRHGVFYEDPKYLIGRKRQTHADIITDAPELYARQLAHMRYETEVNRFIKAVDDNFNLTHQIQRLASDAKIPTDEFVRRFMPDVERHQFSRWKDIFGEEAPLTEATREIFKQTLKQKGLDDSAIKAIEDNGEPYMYLEKDVSEAITKLNNTIRGQRKVGNPLERAAQAYLRGKRAILLYAPPRVLGYLTRNVAPNVEKALSVNIEDLAPNVVNAGKMVIDAYWRKRIDPKLRPYEQRGLLRQFQFETDVAKNPFPEGKYQEIKARLERGDYGSLPKTVKKLFDGYINFGKNADATQDIGARLSVALTAEEMLRRGNGTPLGKNGKLNYMASDQAQISDIFRTYRDMALKNPAKANELINEAYHEAAYKMAQDLFVDPRNLSSVGQYLRQSGMMMFYTYLEGNPRTYLGLARNVALDPTTTGKILKAAGITGQVGARTGLWAARKILQLTAFNAALDAYNNIIMGDVEDKLDRKTKASGHLNLGTTPDGKPLVLTDLSGLKQALRLFGLEPFLSYGFYQQGAPLDERIVKDMLNNGWTTIYNGLLPIARDVQEVVSGESYFPDPTSPRRRDRAEIVFDKLGALEFYRQVWGVPDKEYTDTLWNWFARVYEPDFGKFLDFRERISAVEAQFGIERGFSTNDRSRLVHDYVRTKNPERKEALRGDMEDAGVTGKMVNSYRQRLSNPLKYSDKRVVNVLKRMISESEEISGEYDAYRRYVSRYIRERK